MSKELESTFNEIEKSGKQALAKLEEIAKKPKYYFFYDVGESYAHEINKEDEDPDLHLGGVENATVTRKTAWNHYGSTVTVTVEVEDDIILTNDGYLQYANASEDTHIKVAYPLEDARFIRDIWDERIKELNQSGI